MAIVIFAVLGGLVPAIFWLWFWLKEDAKRPEPKGVIIYTFILGGLAVIPTFILQRLLSKYFDWNLGQGLLTLIISWAAIEEVSKYLAARLSGLRSRHFDEPVDAMVYLITAALGFAALENSLYLLDSFYARGGLALDFLLLGNFRFIGATVVHIVTSALVGFFIASSFCYGKVAKRLALVVGLFTATLLHSVFNYFIITSNNGALFKIFLTLWFTAILIIFFFEQIKNAVCQIKLKR
jgi:RsiW-degrading membrane proteinase PrsW (M82 family)